MEVNPISEQAEIVLQSIDNALFELAIFKEKLILNGETPKSAINAIKPITEARKTIARFTK